MAVSRILTTLLPLITLLPLAYYFYRQKSDSSISKIVYGGATASVVLTLHLIFLTIIYFIDNNFILAKEITEKSFIVAQTQFRTAMFWYLFLSVVISEPLRFIGMDKLFPDGMKLKSNLFFGLGWIFVEIFTRFIFFEGLQLSLLLFVIFYTASIVLCITVLMVRVYENTKFVMYSAFLKFFAEMSLFGTIGYRDSSSEVIFQLTAVLLLSLSLVGMSILVLKFPLIEDDEVKETKQAATV